MDMAPHEHSSSSSSSGSSSSPQPAKKRPAGRTKFRETRHPVFRGVRRRGNAGRWVCEVRVPGRRGCRLWLGTYVTAEAAARAHDAAMLALGGRGSSPACLNFPDSAWLLAVPRLPTADLADVRRAAVEAVAEFQRREAASGAVDEVTSRASAAEPSVLDISASSCFSNATAPADDRVLPAKKSDEPTALDGIIFEEPDWFGGMDFDTYYANLAEGLLMAPPPPTWEHGDCGDGAADVALWGYSYY
jgi:hypothetical protein